MHTSIGARISTLRATLSEADMFLGPPLEPAGMGALRDQALFKLGMALPANYLDFLCRHDGLVAEGVSLYSSIPYPYPDGGSAFAMIDMNLMARDLAFMVGFLELGASDMDCYVYESATGQFQVRDRVAFDNVYEAFSSFDDLLGHVLELIEQRQ